MPTQQGVQKKYGGKWRDVGDWGGTTWSRAPRLDPIGQLVWSDQYGWQDAGQMKRMAKRGGDFSGLTKQMDPDFLKYFMAKPEGTSDPELRAQYGQDWMGHFAGSDFFENYAQQQMAGMDPSHQYFNTYGPNWNWGNEAAGANWQAPGQPEIPPVGGGADKIGGPQVPGRTVNPMGRIQQTGPGMGMGMQMAGLQPQRQYGRGRF